MRSPSARVLIQSCSVYPAIATTDATGGIQFTYPSSASGAIPCTAQPREYEEAYENERVTLVRVWWLMFATDPGIRPRDKLTWDEPGGLSHTGFTRASRPEANRGAAWSVTVVEKL
jgi:hypothetical protein